MRIIRFEDSIAWMKARVLANEIYDAFSGIRDYAFKDQICRAAISILNNIAEGFERQTNKELKNFLYIAKGSSGEVRSMLYLALDLKYIKKDEFNLLTDKATEVSKILSGLIKTLQC